jgi:hypothetical protein
MKEKKFFLGLVALTALILSVGFFAVSVSLWSFMLLHPDGIVLAQWVVAFGFSLAILSMTALVWCKQKHSHFVLDDVAFCSSIVVGLAGALGLLVLLLGVCGVEIPEPMMTAVKFPTLGMMALGFIGLALFFALQCVGAISHKNWWTTVQTGCLALTMLTIVVGLGRVSLFPTSLTAREVFYGMATISLALAGVSVFQQRRKYDN